MQSLKSDYTALKSLELHHGYKLLETLWLYELNKVEEARDKAAKRGSETAWKYWAGYEKGFKLAVMQLKSSLAHMELENEELQGEGKFEGLMKELRGETI